MSYVLEIELPGITDPEQLIIEWMTSRTLLVEGLTQRPDLPTATPPENPKSPPNGSSREASIPLAPTAGSSTKEAKILLSERRVGKFQSHFTFPVHVDPHMMETKLEGGLHQITINKQERVTDNLKIEDLKVTLVKSIECAFDDRKGVSGIGDRSAKGLVLVYKYSFRNLYATELKDCLIYTYSKGP